MKRIGILGGGQLGTMLASAVHDLGANVAIYDPDPSAPACTRFRDVTSAPWTDADALTKFFSRCDAVTYELEHIETRTLRTLGSAVPIFPSLDVLETAHDRAREKAFLRRSGLPFVDFAVARGGEALRRAAAAFGFPFILKTARGGYDGKGQALVRTHEELEAMAAAQNENDTCVLEEVIDLVLEVEEVIDLVLEASCIIGRSQDGTEAVFPVFENVHAGHILDFTLVPARVSADLAAALQCVAVEASRALAVTGLLTTEFFVTHKSASRSQGLRVGEFQIFVNELAPRPHNSGHVTRSACSIDQFELLARILLGVPLPSPSPVGAGYYCMGNLLGDIWIAQGRSDLDLGALARFKDVESVVLYGKREAQARRKMGHFITHAADAEGAMRAAKEFRQALSSPSRTPRGA